MATSNTGTGRFASLHQFVADGIPCIFGHPGSSEENLLDAQPRCCAAAHVR